MIEAISAEKIRELLEEVVIDQSQVAEPEDIPQHHLLYPQSLLNWLIRSQGLKRTYQDAAEARITKNGQKQERKMDERFLRGDAFETLASGYYETILAQAFKGSRVALVGSGPEEFIKGLAVLRLEQDPTAEHALRAMTGRHYEPDIITLDLVTGQAVEVVEATLSEAAGWHYFVEKETNLKRARKEFPEVFGKNTKLTFMALQDATLPRAVLSDKTTRLPIPKTEFARFMTQFYWVYSPSEVDRPLAEKRPDLAAFFKMDEKQARKLLITQFNPA